jgi:putative transposase
MNAIMERWVQPCRRELPGRTLIWNQRQPLRALRLSGASCNGHRPHQRIANARLLNPLPPAIADPDQIARLDLRRHRRLGGILNGYRQAALRCMDEIFGNCGAWWESLRNSGLDWMLP